MKALLLIPLFLMTINTYGQEADPAPAKRQPGKNEIGIFINPIANDNAAYDAPVGLQYKRWTTPNLAYRIMTAVGGYGSEYRSTELIKDDTLHWSLTSTNMAMLFVGGGLEVQRRFVGKCYLYAAIEMKAGYGSGYTHTSEVTETATVSSWERFYTYEQRGVSSTTTSVFVLDALPYVGAKMNFRRWVVGTEISAIVSGITKINQGGLNFSNTSFNFGQLQQRLYVHYRF